MTTTEKLPAALDLLTDLLLKHPGMTEDEGWRCFLAEVMKPHNTQAREQVLVDMYFAASTALGRDYLTPAEVSEWCEEQRRARREQTQ